jgi:uncharacterized Zn finger protein
MVMAKLHIICGNCGSNDMFEYKIDKDAKDFGDRFEEGVYIKCDNCGTLHSLDDNAKFIKK